MVSTGIEAVKEVAGPVLIGETPEEFANAVGKWLDAPRETARQQAQDHAGANSWDARADAFLQFAQELPLAAKDAADASTTSA